MAKRNTKIEASVSNGILNLRVSGRIWANELAGSFKYQIDSAIAQNITSAVLYLNTEGGSVFEANEAINELKRLDNVKVTVGSLAASAGTMFLCHFETECFATSQFMIHKPLTQMHGNEDEVKAELKVLGNLTNVYRTAYSKKMGITEAQVDELWKNDYWMDAKEAKEKGLISNIIDEELEVDESTIAMMQACGCPNVPEAPKPKENNNNNTNMDINQLRSALGMSATATEQEVLTRVNENKTKADTAAATEAAAKEQGKNNAERVVNQAILDKKITADLKDVYVSLHIQDPGATEEILKGMKGVKAASENLKDTPDGDDIPAGRENWSIEDYLEKDPAGFDALCDTNPGLVKKLNAAYSKKNKIY